MGNMSDIPMLILIGFRLQQKRGVFFLDHKRKYRQDRFCRK